MRMTHYQITRQRGVLLQNSRKLIVCGVLLMTLGVSGCSAVNMTGFSFPSFGLNEDSSEQSSALTISPTQEESQLTGTSSQRLLTQ